VARSSTKREPELGGPYDEKRGTKGGGAKENEQKTFLAELGEVINAGGLTQRTHSQNGGKKRNFWEQKGTGRNRVIREYGFLGIQNEREKGDQLILWDKGAAETVKVRKQKKDVFGLGPTHEGDRCDATRPKNTADKEEFHATRG